ncbi:MAG TPA: hypothetical protein PLN55_09890 [Burkholderiaceae bacterium]|nr:hypothetical protein [Burkholderiaceae bacterium]
MFWPITLIRRPRPAPPTLDSTRRERLRAAQFELLEAQACAEDWAHRVDMLLARCKRLEGRIEDAS